MNSQLTVNYVANIILLFAAEKITNNTAETNNRFILQDEEPSKYVMPPKISTHWFELFLQLTLNACRCVEYDLFI